MRKQSLKSIYDLSKKNKKIVFIGSDLGAGVLDDMKKNSPDRFFMEGVSEQHILGMAAGLAMDGFIPFVNTISTFFYRRALEQVILTFDFDFPAFDSKWRRFSLCSSWTNSLLLKIYLF